MDAILSLLLVSALQPTPEDQAILDRLERTTFPYSGEMTLREVLGRVHDVAQVSYYVHPNVDPDGTSVTIVVRGQPILQVLRICQGTLDPALAFEVRGGILYVIPADELMTRTTLVAYSIRDLVYWTPDFPGPGEPGLDPPGQAATVDGYGGFTADDMIDLIQQTIEPDAWDQYNWSLTSEQDMLLVTTIPRIHERILALLAELRATESVQVRIEGRLVELSTADAWEWRQARGPERQELLTADQEQWIEDALEGGGARMISLLGLTAMNTQRNHAYEATVRPFATGSPVHIGNLLDVRPVVDRTRTEVTIEVRATFAWPRPREAPAGASIFDVYRHRSTLLVPAGRTVVASLVAREGRALALLLRATVETREPPAAEPVAGSAEDGLLDEAPEAPAGHGIRWDSPSTARECLRVRLEGDAARLWLRERPGPELEPAQAAQWISRGTIESWAEIAAFDGQEANVMSVVGFDVSTPPSGVQDLSLLGHSPLFGTVAGGRLIRGPDVWTFELRFDTFPFDGTRGPAEAPVEYRQTRASLQLRPGVYRVVAEHGSGEEISVTLARAR